MIPLGYCQFCYSQDVKESWGDPGFYFCNTCKNGDVLENLLSKASLDKTVAQINKINLKLDSSNPCGEIPLGEWEKAIWPDNGVADY